MSVHSVLAPDGQSAAGSRIEDTPLAESLRDLNLDQVIAALERGREQYELAEFYRTPLRTLDAVRYRQEVFQDVESNAVRDAVDRFAESMRRVRALQKAVKKAHYPRQAQRWLLDAILLYCHAVEALTESLAAASLQSRGMLGLRDHLRFQTASQAFTTCRDQAQGVLDELNAVRYALLIRGARIAVGRYDGEANYSAEVTDTFARFRRTANEASGSELPRAGMSHVDAQILDLVARLFPDLFGRLEAFCTGNWRFVDETIAVFDRELQFYLAYLDYVAPLRKAGLCLCYPGVAADSKRVRADETYDLALATKLVAERSPVVVNDLRLDDPERILVVSGPNQGGKTTLARTFGQLHYLASLGCPVPGAAAQVPLADSVLTHFEREENLDTLAGKLEDDLVRIRTILDRATPRSVIVLNEVFASTTLKDALWLSKDLLGRIEELDALCLCVTFLDELSRLSPKTVSMVSTVVAEDPTRRTYKVVRRPADGRAYAVAIAEKYGLTYEALKERISR